MTESSPALLHLWGDKWMTGYLAACSELWAQGKWG